MIKTQSFKCYEVNSTDENDVQPETLEVEWDNTLVVDARELLAKNPWIDAIQITLNVDFTVDDNYGGKARGGKLIVYFGVLYFKFYNDYTDTVYTVELKED